MLHATTKAMESHGASSSLATQQAYALIANTVQRQATMLAYIDNFWLLGLSIMAMIPVVFLMRKGKPGSMAVH
jgi:DHA2 family multidrug resistance protein